MRKLNYSEINKPQQKQHSTISYKGFEVRCIATSNKKYSYKETKIQQQLNKMEG